MSHLERMERMLDRMGGLWSVNDLVALIRDGKMQSFTEGDSWIVTQISDFPGRKVLDVITIVGKLDDCIKIHNRLPEFAESEGCTMMRAFGRRGWMPVATNLGWRPVTTGYIYLKDAA